MHQSADLLVPICGRQLREFCTTRNLSQLQTQANNLVSKPCDVHFKRCFLGAVEFHASLRFIQLVRQIDVSNQNDDQCHQKHHDNHHHHVGKRRPHAVLVSRGSPCSSQVDEPVRFHSRFLSLSLNPTRNRRAMSSSRLLLCFNSA